MCRHSRRQDGQRLMVVAGGSIMSRELVKSVLGNVARSAAHLLKSVPTPVPSVRVVEIHDGVVVMVSVCPVGDRLPTIRDEDRPSERAAEQAEVKLAPRTERVLTTVQLLRASDPLGHLGPKDIRTAMKKGGDQIGKSTLAHSLTALVRLGLLVRDSEDGYVVPDPEVPARAGTSTPTSAAG